MQRSAPDRTVPDPVLVNLIDDNVLTRRAIDISEHPSTFHDRRPCASRKLQRGGTHG
jgi:hypothetical protein